MTFPTPYLYFSVLVDLYHISLKLENIYDNQLFSVTLVNVQFGITAYGGTMLSEKQQSKQG